MNAAARRVIANLKIRGLLDLVDHVCVRRGVTREELCGRSQTRSYARARHELWYLMIEHHERYYSHSEIGRLFERDHTTVMGGVRAHRRREAGRQINATL